MLAPTGKLALIYPVERVPEALEIASGVGLHLIRSTYIKGNANAKVKRVLLEWGLISCEGQVRELIVETATRGVYTQEYQELTESFYLSND